MANEGIGWVRFFIGFGFVAMCSGLYTLFQGEYVQGISGTAVGAFLIYLNLKKNKEVGGE